MEPVQVGYIIMVILLFIIASIIIYHKWNNKNLGLTSIEDVISLNKWIYQEVERELLNCQVQLQFLNQQLPNTIPKVVDLKRQVQEKLYFWKALRGMIEFRDSRKEITQVEWAQMLDAAAQISEYRINNRVDPKNQSLNRQVDKDIEELVEKGSLPVEDIMLTRAGQNYIKNHPNTGQTDSTKEDDDPRDQPYHGQLG